MIAGELVNDDNYKAIQQRLPKGLRDILICCSNAWSVSHPEELYDLDFEIPLFIAGLVVVVMPRLNYELYIEPKLFTRDDPLISNIIDVKVPMSEAAVQCAFYTFPWATGFFKTFNGMFVVCIENNDTYQLTYQAAPDRFGGLKVVFSVGNGCLATAGKE